MAGDKFDQLYNALKADGAVSGTREHFRQFVYAPGKQGYHNRKQLYDALYADGAVSSKSYEEFAQRLGLHAVNPKPQQQKPLTMKQRAQEVAAQYQQTHQPTDYLHRPQNQMGRARRNAPGKASPFVQSLYEIDNAQKGPDYSVDYTSPKATQQVYQQNQQLRRQAAKTAGDHIVNDEYRRQSQPMIDNGTVGVMKPMGEIEQEMSDAADSLVASSGDFIKNSINNEYKQATLNAENEIRSNDAMGNPFMGSSAGLISTQIANKYESPDKIMASLQNSIKENIANILPQAREQAIRLGVSEDYYINNLVLPKMVEKAVGDFRETEVARRMPKNDLDYFIQEATSSNYLAKLGTMLLKTKSQRQFDEEALARTNEGMNPNYKPSTALRVGADVVGMISDPIFGASAKAGGLVAGKLIGNSTKIGTLMANGNLLQRLTLQGTQAVTSGGVTGFVFDSTGSVIQNYSTGEDTSLGNTLSVAAKGGATGAANFATMSLASVPLSQLGRSIGLKGVEGGSFWGNTGRATAKVVLETGKTYMEAMGMYLGGYVAGKIEGHTDANGNPVKFDLWNGTIESLPTAIGFRIQHAIGGLKGGRKNEKGEDMGWAASTLANFREFLTSDKAKVSKFMMSEEEKKQIMDSFDDTNAATLFHNVYGAAKNSKTRLKTTDGIFEKPYVPEPTKYEDVERDLEGVRTVYDKIMADPNVSWDAKAKFSAMVMGIMPSARPKMDFVGFSTGYVDNVQHKYVDEYSDKGELLSRREYKNISEREAVIYKLKANAENVRLRNAVALVAGIDKNNYELQNAFFQMKVNRGANANDVIEGLKTPGSEIDKEFSEYAMNMGNVNRSLEFVADNFNKSVDWVLDAFEKDPMYRNDDQQKAAVLLRRSLENTAFPNGKVHEEQSKLNGKDVAEDNSLGTEQPNGDAVKKELNDLRQAEEEVEVLMRDNDVFSQNFKKLQSQGLTNPQIYDWMVQQGGLTVEQLEPFAHYINANARVQGMQEATKQKIENVASSFVQDWSYRDRLNGVGMVNADGSAETVLFVYHDGKELIVGSGDVSFNQPNEYGIRRAKEDVGDMLVCFDPQTGQMVYVHASEVDYSREMKPEELKAQKILELQNINSVPYNEAAQEQAMLDTAKPQQNEQEAPQDNTTKSEDSTTKEGDLTKDNTTLTKVDTTSGEDNTTNEDLVPQEQPQQKDYRDKLADLGIIGKDESPVGGIKNNPENGSESRLTKAQETLIEKKVERVLENPNSTIANLHDAIVFKLNNGDRSSANITVLDAIYKVFDAYKRGEISKEDVLNFVKEQFIGEEDNPLRVALEAKREKSGVSPQEQHQPTRKFADGSDVPMTKDSKGRPTPDYEKMTPEQSAEILTEDFGDNAEKVVDGQIQKAEKALKDAEKMKVDYTAEPNDIIEQESLKKKTVEAAKKQLDHAQNIKKAMTSKKVAETVGKTEQTEGAHEAGSVAAQKFVNAPRLVGNKRTRMLPDGETKIKGRYEIVPAESLTPSHDVNNDYKKSEGFPTDAEGRTVNDRDYEHDKAARQNTDQIARKYNGMAIEQVPVVSDEGIVYDGNGRTMAGQKAAKEGTDGEYINDLLENAENFGFTREQIEQSGIEHPRLVLVTDERLPYDTATFSKFNRNEKKTQSNTEQAVAKAKTLTSDEVGAIVAEIEGNGSLEAFFNNSKAINDLVKTLVDKGIIGQNEVAQMMDSPERLSAQGREYVKNLLLGSIFKPETIRMLGIDSTVKNKAINAIRSVMDNMKLGEFSLRDEIDQAIQLLYEARQGGNKVDTLLRTPDMYVEDAAKRYPSISQMMALALEGKVADFRDLLDEYNRIAKARNTGEGNMFEAAPTKEELIKEFLDFKKWQDYGTGHSENEGGNDVSGVEEPQQKASGGNEPAEAERPRVEEPDDLVNKELESRIEVTDEETETPSKNGPIMKQKILIDGDKEVIKVDEPNENGEYTGSYYEYDGKKYGDLNEVTEYIDSKKEEGSLPLLPKEEKPNSAGFTPKEIRDHQEKLDRAKEKYVKALKEAKSEKEIKAAEGEFEFAYKDHQNMNGVLDEASVADMWNKELESAKDSVKKDSKEPSADPMEGIKQAADAFHEEQKQKGEFAMNLKIGKARQDYAAAKESGDAERTTKAAKELKHLLDDRLKQEGKVLAERQKIIAEEIGKAEAEIIDKPWEQMDLEEREAVSSKNPLTESEINELTSEENKELIPAALAYLRGDKSNIINAISYFKIWNDVRNRHENVSGNSGTENGTQLDAADTTGGEGLGLGRGRESGRPDGPVDRGTGNETAPGERNGGESNQNDTTLSAGEQGNKQGEGNSSGMGAVPAGSSDTNGSGSAGGNGNVSGGSGRESSNRPADTNAGRKPTAKQGTTFPDSTAERLKKERADYEKKKKDFWDRWKKAGQGYAKIALTPFKKLNLTPEQIEMLPELVKMHLNGAVLKIKEGIYKFNEWKAAMLAEEGEELKMIGLSDDDIDRFIEDYWNTPYEMDGETHTIREWSSIYGNQQLKKKLKEPLEEKYKRQMEAEPIEVKVGDMKNIEETLPYLLPQQQEDVLKAETQFFGKEHSDREHAYGKGYLFTNGTGTGKTYTGLGIAKRLAKQGKGRILFITPSQKKVSDWIKDGKNLGLDIKDLDSWAKERGTTATTESGEGMVITTFANFGLNKKLLETEWDAVIYDECHRIMENKKGTETARSMQHYMVTNRDENHCFQRLQSINPEYQKMNGAAEKFDALRLKEIDRIKKEYKNSHPSATNRDVDNATLKSLPRDLNGFAPADGMTFPKLGKAYQDFIKARDAYNKVEPKLKEQAKDSWKNTKTIFLSATPFNTRENLDYVEGYIFKYPETDERGMGGRTQFYLNHFGAAYKFRYHRLEQSISNPDAVAKQEVAFSDYLQNTLGTMSGRIIDSPYDYSRDFPIVAPDHAEDFNNAVQDTLKTKYLHDAYSKTIGDYNYGSALFETMKVSAAIDRIKQHLDLGRKVVIFHRRVESKEPLEAPFAYMLRVANEQIKMMKPGKERNEYIKECTEFRNKYADLLEWEKTLDYSMPREQIAKVFGEKNVLFFSGKESKKVKDKAVDTFNDDDSGKNIIVIQEASGKEGISLHDTTSKHQRVCITLALPQSPITALQIEGRIYRIGNMSNAIFEYPILGLNSEMMLFGEKFNNQVSTTENLALGSQARNLRDSFAKGILEHSGIVPVENQGVGGKEFDAATPSENDPFDNAVLDYYSNQKLNKNNREGSDYFPTPEPLGYKMVEWAGLGEGDSVLEPSAGHGAIARYVPKTNEMVSIEPSQSLFTKLQLRAGGLGRKFMNNTFENYALNNKHDVIVMNPPFGKAGALAIQHVDKAFKHLDEGGRIVAIIPRGSTDKKFDKWYNEQKNVAMRAEVNLPDILFQQAGTRVACRVVVLDKISDAALRSKAGYPEKIDLSGHYDKIEDFFNDLRDIEIPERIIDTNLKMQKKAKAAVKDIMEIKGVKNVSYGKTGIDVSLTGSWMNYGISFTGSDKPNYWRDKMANYYTKYDELQKLEYQENKQAVFDELKKLSCKLAGMTEDEMQRYIASKSNGGTHFREDRGLQYSKTDTKDVKNSRIIPEDVDKTVSSQIEKKFDDEINRLFTHVTPNIRRWANAAIDLYSKDQTLNSWEVDENKNVTLSEGLNTVIDDLTKKINEYETKYGIRKDANIGELVNSILRKINSEGSGSGRNTSDKGQQEGTGGEAKTLPGGGGERRALDILNDYKALSIRKAAAERAKAYILARSKYLQETYGLKRDEPVSYETIDRIFNDYNSDPEVKELYDSIVNSLRSLGTEFYVGSIELARTKGYYKHSDNFIKLNVDRLSAAGYAKQDLASTLCHEMLHPLTSDTIAMYQKGHTDKLSPSQIEAAKDAVDIYNELIKIQKEGKLGDYYGLENPREMITELASPEWRSALRKIPAAKKWYQKLINAICRMIGKDPKYNKLGEMERTLTNLLDNFGKEQFDFASQNENELFGSEPQGSKVTDPEEIKRLEEEPKIKVYRAMQVIDGKLYPPMAAYADGKLVEANELGKWIQADEMPDSKNTVYKYKGTTTTIPKDRAVKGEDGIWRDSKNGAELAVGEDGNPTWYFKLQKGKGATGKKLTDVPAAYNPYWHTSYSPLNDQFKSAWIRPNVVVVECEVPTGELTSGYRAEHAKDPVGMTPWTSGVVTKQLVAKGHEGRKVMLSRWCKPVRIVPDEEVAAKIKDFIGDYDVEIPENVVTPRQKVELEKLGVKIGAPEKGMNKNEQIAETIKLGLQVDNTVLSEDGTKFRTDHGDGNYPTSSVESYVEKVAQNTGAKVNMVSSVDEITNKAAKAAIEEGRKITGWYDEKTGEVRLYMPNIHDRYTAEKTIWHEVVGHKGMRELFGDERFDKFLRDVWYDLDKPENAALKKLVDEERKFNPLNIYDAIEEGIARLAEDGKGEPGFWNGIKNKVSDFLHEIGYRIAPNTKDVKYLLWLSKNLQKNPNDPYWKMRAEAVKYRLDHERMPAVVAHDGMFYGNDGKVRSMDSLTKSEWDEATDGQIHFRTTPSAGTALDRYHRSLDEHGYMLTESYMDNMLSLKKLMNAIVPDKKIEDIASSENPYMLQNTMQGAMSDAAQMFERNVMKPLDKAMADVLDAFDGKKDDEKIRNFNLYMITKHGLERNREFFVRDFLKQRRMDEQNKQDADFLENSYYSDKEYLDNELNAGNIDLKEYYIQLDESIRNHFDADFEAGEHDYSGMHAIQEVAKSSDPYDDADAIQSVMDSEAKMENIKNGSVKDYWNKVKAATQYSIDSDYKNNIIDKELHDYVSNMFNWYVPLRKYDEATAEDVYGYITEVGDPKTYIGSTIMRARGHKYLSETNVLAQIGAMGNRAIKNGGLNAIKMAFARFARNNSNNNLITEVSVWYEKDPITGIVYERYPDIPEDATPDEINQIVADFNTDMKAKAAQGLASKVYRRGSIGYKFQRAENKSQHIVDVKIAGRTHSFIINGNPRAAQALNGLLEHKNDTLAGRVAASISRNMAQLCTSYNPEFVMRNMIKDFEYASINLLAKEGLRYTKLFEQYYAKVGIIEGIRNSKLKDLADTGGFGLFAKYRNGTLDTTNKLHRYFKEFMENGGETGWVQIKNMEDFTKEYKAHVKTERNKIQKIGMGIYDAIFTNLENINEIAENLARFATYCASRDSNRSVIRSVYDAKVVSTNFNRHGSGNAIYSFKNGEMGTGKTARKNIYGFTAAWFRNSSMFFNAGIQSTNLLIKNFKNNKSGTIGYIASAPFISGMAMALLNNFIISNEDEKDRKGVKDPYAELPDYIRRNNLCIYIGGGEFVTIPLAIEERAFYGLGDFAAGMTFSKNISSQKMPNLTENKDIDKYLNPFMDAVGCMSQLVPVADYLGNDSFGKHPVQETIKAVAPSATSPFLEWVYNSDWKGAPIQRDNKFDENQPSWMLAYKGTPEWMINMNKKVNALTNDVAPGNEDMKGNDFLDEVTNPSALHHFYGSYFGGAATFVERVGGLIKNGKDTETKDIPFLRSLLYTPNEQSSLQRTKSKWYNYKDEMEKTMANVDRLKSKNVPLDKRITNIGEYYQFQNSKEAAKVRVIDLAEKQMKRWKKVRDKSSDTESINFANQNIDKIMMDAVDELDRLE